MEVLVFEIDKINECNRAIFLDNSHSFIKNEDYFLLVLLPAIVETHEQFIHSYSYFSNKSQYIDFLRIALTIFHIFF